MTCVYIKSAKYIREHLVFIEFSDGKTGEVDLKPIIDKYAQAKSLKNKRTFSQFHLDSWPTLAWDCGFDIAPETLYKMINC